MPAVASGLVFPSKEVSAAISSHAPEHILPHSHKGGASKPEGIAIHSRCCCRHHKQDNEQRTALKSRSSESLRKEVIYHYHCHCHCHCYCYYYTIRNFSRLKLVTILGRSQLDSQCWHLYTIMLIK